MITVFYDGKCGLCRREIEHYKRIAHQGIFDWVDITKTPDPFTSRGYVVKEGLKALHVEDGNGRMRIGMAAFGVIWSGLPWAWPLLSYPLRVPLILSLAEAIYFRFAAWRFKRLGYDKCDI
jgi:predicted DCC family thiol-disulfide oxidoreductase YuxK